jgi:GcrA cell cycle regulator
MDWTAQAIEQLRALWAEGHSTAEIGRRMGVTKNAIVGKAHRLNLPARPSPIRREPGAVRAPQQPRRVQQAPVFRVAAPQPAIARRPEQAPTPRPVIAAPAPAPAAVVRAFPRSGNRSCCWPLGEPGTPEFRFCSAESIMGKPYCAEHAAVAYVRVRDRREDAA